MRQRITLLKDYIPQTLDEVKTIVRENLYEGERKLSSSFRKRPVLALRSV